MRAIQSTVSLIVKDKVTRQCPQTTTFEEKGECCGTFCHYGTTKVTKRIKFDALPARFVTAARFVTTW